MNKHLNTGSCEKCKEIINTYPNFHQGLKEWFFLFQKENKDAHISMAGRGKALQEREFIKGTSLAHFKQSPHNWNAALDFWRLNINGADFSLDWFKTVLIPNAVKAGFEAGGLWKKFKDYPHIEVKNWKDLVKEGKLTLVEPE